MLKVLHEAIDGNKRINSNVQICKQTEMVIMVSYSAKMPFYLHTITE